jgi:hypothetical protein
MMMKDRAALTVLMLWPIGKIGSRQIKKRPIVLQQKPKQRPSCVHSMSASLVLNLKLPIHPSKEPDLIDLRRFEAVASAVILVRVS